METVGAAILAELSNEPGYIVLVALLIGYVLCRAVPTAPGSNDSENVDTPKRRGSKKDA